MWDNVLEQLINVDSDHPPDLGALRHQLESWLVANPTKARLILSKVLCKEENLLLTVAQAFLCK